MNDQLFRILIEFYYFYLFGIYIQGRALRFTKVLFIGLFISVLFNLIIIFWFFYNNSYEFDYRTGMWYGDRIQCEYS